MDEVETGTDTPLTDVLGAFADAGFAVAFTPVADGRLRCGTCESTFAAGELSFTAQHRMEGASDPADAMLVVGGPCPVCDRPGTLSVGYGPGTSEIDTQVVLALPEPESPVDPVTLSR